MQNEAEARLAVLWRTREFVFAFFTGKMSMRDFVWESQVQARSECPASGKLGGLPTHLKYPSGYAAQ